MGAVLWPRAFSFLNGERIAKLKSNLLPGAGIPNEIFECTVSDSIVGTSKDLKDIEIHLGGKQRMTMAEFLRGYRNI